MRAVADRLGLARQTVHNKLWKHRELFPIRRYRGRTRVLTEDEIVSLASLFIIRVK